MKQTEHSKKEPLFHIVKRENLSIKKKATFYAVAILLGLFLGGTICSLYSSKNIFDFFSSLYHGALGSSRRIWLLLQETALLLGVSLALSPAFKMKFWNLGGNGQILMGCLAYVASMFYLGGNLPDVLVMIIGLITGIIAGAVWALIPALFKAFFNTNESLFTLMMNYIAAGLVGVFITIWVKTGSGVLKPLSKGTLPVLFNKPSLLPIIVFFALAIAMHAYLKYSKQGYEISVVGESNNTAKYVGISTRRVIIRTMILSGAIAGLVGAIIGGGINHTVSAASASNMGFTAIMTSWLAAFNPLIMMASSLFIAFISKGMTQVRKDFNFTNDAISNIVIGVVYFAVIAVTFFLSYKVVFRDGAFDSIKRIFTKKAKANKKEEE